MKRDDTAIAQQALEFVNKKEWQALLGLVQDGRWDVNRPIPYYGKFSYLVLPILIDGGATDAAIAVIGNGAELNVWQEGWTPLMLACQRQNHAVIDALIAAGADLNLQAPRSEDGGGETALICAAQHNDAWTVRRLLEAGADVSRVTRAKESALHWAAAMGAPVEVVRLLADAGSPRLGNELHQPVWNRDFPVVQCLLDCGFDVNARVKRRIKFQEIEKGDTPFIVAVRQNTRELYQIESPGTPPEDSVARLRRDRRRIAELLLEKGADPNAANDAQLSALAYVVIQRDREYVQWLLGIGAQLACKPVDRPRLESLMQQVLEGKATLDGDLLI
jgi:ankyrin repeat protein